MSIFAVIFIAIILTVGLFLYWIYRIIKLLIIKRYKIAIIHTFILFILLFGALWQLRIIPLSSTNDFKNKTAELTGKKFWSWNEFRHEDISVRGEGFTFEIYKLKPEVAEYFENPPNSFFENYPTDDYSAIKWKKTPIPESEKDKLDFVMPTFGNWSDKDIHNVVEKQKLIKELASSGGSYYVLDTIVNKDVTLYLIAPKQKLIVWINHNM